MKFSTTFLFLLTQIDLSLSLPISQIIQSLTDFSNNNDTLPEEYKPLIPGEIPQYVTDFAPVVHLYAEEVYLPYSIEEYIKHFILTTGDGANLTKSSPLQLADLEPLQSAYLNSAASSTSPPPKTDDLFLTALSDFDTDPSWITGVKNIPEIGTGYLKDAPATLIVVDKGDGWVDAFWFYFYSFNLGPFVMGGGPYGNHVGDWEHSLVRFYKGKPKLVWMSAHGGGTAYKYEGMELLEMNAIVPNNRYNQNINTTTSSDSESELHEEKYPVSNRTTKRPVIFSGRGTHANYATVGQHSHDLPYYILSDFTDRGPLWDPAKNFYAYTYDGANITFANGTEPGREERLGNWLMYLGHWGDKQLPSTDPRQKFSPFQWRYIDGPLGPITKNLMRTGPCQRYKWWNFLHMCDIRSTLDMGEGIEGEGAGCRRLFDNVKPYFIRVLLRLVTWRGWGCSTLENLFG